MIFLKISKTQTLPQKHPINKNSKSHVRRPQMKKFRKQNMVGIDKY